jgi:hypothetical protein
MTQTFSQLVHNTVRSSLAQSLRSSAHADLWSYPTYSCIVRHARHHLRNDGVDPTVALVAPVVEAAQQLFGDMHASAPICQSCGRKLGPHDCDDSGGYTYTRNCDCDCDCEE